MSESTPVQELAEDIVRKMLRDFAEYPELVEYMVVEHPDKYFTHVMTVINNLLKKPSETHVTVNLATFLRSMRNENLVIEHARLGRTEKVLDSLE